MRTFINLPQKISDVISGILSNQKENDWILRAKKLHDRYISREQNGIYINDSLNALAYLSLRIPATYAQIYSAFLQVQEMIPSWNPKSLLDIGSGPGTAVWAANDIWTGLKKAKCIDKDKNLLSIGDEIAKKTSISVDISWERGDIREMSEHENKYELVVIANVLNELTLSQQENLLKKAFDQCNGVLIIIEPGTSIGIDIIQKVSKTFIGKANLLAPYINNSLPPDSETWIHFSQRFIRPEFQRRIRQYMRDSSLMASGWEDSKYAYLATGKIFPEVMIWGRCIGPVKKQKGYLEIPVLTKDEIKQIKILKRNKKEYNFAKNLKWGEVIKNANDVMDNITTIIQNNLLKQHEMIEESHLKNLFNQIKKDDFISDPIIVDKNTMIILDGHHRYNAIKRMDLRSSPVYLVDYKSEKIKVTSWKKGKNNITKELVINAGLSGNLLKPKTSRHIINEKPKGLKTPLSKLV